MPDTGLHVAAHLVLLQVMAVSLDFNPIHATAQCTGLLAEGRSSSLKLLLLIPVPRLDCCFHAPKSLL